MTTYHYETESHMRANHPWIANHLATIANEQDGIMTAQLNGVTYSWGSAALRGSASNEVRHENA